MRTTARVLTTTIASLAVALLPAGCESEGGSGGSSSSATAVVEISVNTIASARYREADWTFDDAGNATADLVETELTDDELATLKAALRAVNAGTETAAGGDAASHSIEITHSDGRSELIAHIGETRFTFNGAQFNSADLRRLISSISARLAE